MKRLEQVLNEANKCLNCKNAICVQKGCPVNTDIPNFISKIKEKNFEYAYHILQENNIMSDICSKICPVEKQCMGSCIKGIKGSPIKINELESFVNEWAKDNNVEHEIKCNESNNIKVAIIGRWTSRNVV